MASILFFGFYRQIFVSLHPMALSNLYDNDDTNDSTTDDFDGDYDSDIRL